MSLTDAQQQALATALRAEINPGVVAALTLGDSVVLERWCNDPSALDAWHWQCGAIELFNAANITLFNNLTDKNRDTWKYILAYAPHDYRLQKNRESIADVWGSVLGLPILQGCAIKATNVQRYLGGAVIATTNAVSALVLTFTGRVSGSEVSEALNRF